MPKLKPSNIGPDSHELALASVIRAVMGAKTPRVTEAELGRRTGITQSTINRALKAERKMLARDLWAIAKALDVDAGELMDEADRVRRGREDAHTAALRIAR